MTLQPPPERCRKLFGIFGDYDDRQPPIPILWVFLLIDFGPWRVFPVSFEDDDPVVLGNVIGSTDHITDFFGQMLDVLTMLEQLVVPGVRQQFRLRIFFVLENQTFGDSVNVEAVVFDICQFCLKLVIVDGLVSCDIDL